MLVYESTNKMINLVTAMGFNVEIDHENEKYLVYKHKRPSDILKVFEEWESMELDMFLYGITIGWLSS